MREQMSAPWCPELGNVKLLLENPKRREESKKEERER
jgi:hypothetical protein